MNRPKAWIKSQLRLGHFHHIDGTLLDQTFTELQNRSRRGMGRILQGKATSIIAATTTASTAIVTTLQQGTIHGNRAPIRVMVGPGHVGHHTFRPYSIGGRDREQVR